MKRNRDLANRDLNGTNIKVTKRSGYIDYYYKMPDGTLENLGQNRKDAVEAAIILNQELRPSGNIAARIINRKPKNNTQTAATPLDNVAKLIKEFKTHLAKNTNSTRTRKEKYIRLMTYEQTWGDRSTATITTNDIAVFLNDLSDHSYIKHRSLLESLFGFAIHQGYRNDNPVMQTLTRTEPKRVRQRHTLAGYQQIHAAAPDWLKRAMSIALHSLQRRGDLTRLHKDQVDMQAGTITILQEKTRNYTNPVYITIKMGEELQAAVTACLNSGINCPYLLHYRPKRITKEIRENKLHVFAINDKYLSDQFSETRDKAGAYSNLPPEERPTFHDLRALGAYLYEKQGFTHEYIQALTGHASEAMLQHYIAGHEAPLPVTVNANLTLNKEIN